MSTNIIPSTPIAAIDNTEPLQESEIDTTPTDKIPVVNMKQPLQTLGMDIIPSTPIPTIDHPAPLLLPLSIGIIPTTPMLAPDSRQQAIALGIDKIPTVKLPSIHYPLVTSKRKRKGPLLLMAGVVTLLLFSLLASTYLLASAMFSLPIASQNAQHTLSQATDQQTKSTRQQPSATALPIPTIASNQDAQAITALGQHYMKALLNQQYDAMWSLLHPRLQAMWPDETSFITYWQTRFHGFTLQQFTLGEAHTLPFWVNPETMIRYDQVEVLPISLQLSPQISADKLSLLPTPDQNPNQLFQNLPLIAQQTTIRTGKESVDRWLILSGGPADLEAPILPPLTPVSRMLTMPILMYHHISDIPPRNILDHSLTVTPDVFSQQLDYLKQHRYHTITFNQLFNFLYYHGPLPNKPIILSFDDGYDDAYKFAYPILQAHDYSGVFYIITGKAGWKGQASWNQLREMLAHGMQMGSHTITHPNIGAVWRYSHEEAQQELQQSRQDMQTQLGIVIQQFCYPTGEPFHHEKLIVQQAIMSLLEQDGYIGATTDPPPMGMTQDSQKPFMLLRTRVDGRETWQEFINSIP